MTRTIALMLALAVAPVAAVAMPKIGDVVGTKPDDAKVALEKADCLVDEFEAEDGKIEAKCADAKTGKAMEVYIDPKTGAVTDIKDAD